MDFEKMHVVYSYAEGSALCVSIALICFIIPVFHYITYAISAILLS